LAITSGSRLAIGVGAALVLVAVLAAALLPSGAARAAEQEAHDDVDAVHREPELVWEEAA
ncbi:MAG TPA: hypothetical protein VK506_09240, partial [Conexibacter sp.]|nr:hypothetical protein [Conexibacter sp.]